MGLDYQLSVSREAAIKAGEFILEKCRTRDLQIEYKPDGSPTTNADKGAELIIRNALSGVLPTNSFIGEELGIVDGSDGFRWYCDPIDATWSVINGENTASTSLALTKNGITVLSVVYNPFTRELFAGAEGIPTTLNYEPLPRFNRHIPAEAVYNFQISAKRITDALALFDLWKNGAIGKLISRGGSIAYNLAQVAEGSHSVYVVSSTKPSDKWDVAGGIYLVESVGGKVTLMDEGRILIASTNPQIHKSTLELLVQTGFGKRD